MKIASWKTASAGAGGIIALIAGTINKLTDNDPTTVVDWNTVIPLLFACVIGLFSRDKNVSSEQEGIKPSPTVIVSPPPP